MDLRYFEFDPAFESLKELMGKLRRLFDQLLMRTAGDVGEALRWMEALGQQHGFFEHGFSFEDFQRMLEQERSVARDPHTGNMKLTGKGERGLRTSSLDAIFQGLRSDVAGDHRVAAEGSGPERLPETRPFEFGDPVEGIAVNETLRNALRRGGPGDIAIAEEDFEVYLTDHHSSCATVLLIDVSHSMILYGEDRITPAKQVALALTELIQTRYPKDSLDVVLFGDEAWRVPTDRLPYVDCGPFHTNTRAGLRLARDLLRGKRQRNRQIFMVTDGKPSALTERNGDIYKNPFGLDRRIVNKTLEEADGCRRAGIPITSFMLTDDPTLVDFIETLTQTNRGRAYYASAERVGSFVLVDYLRNRRRRN